MECVCVCLRLFLIYSLYLFEILKTYRGSPLVVMRCVDPMRALQTILVARVCVVRALRFFCTINCTKKEWFCMHQIFFVIVEGENWPEHKKLQCSYDTTSTSTYLYGSSTMEEKTGKEIGKRFLRLRFLILFQGSALRQHSRLTRV